MISAATVKKINTTLPSLAVRMYSVWFRHFRVYTKNLYSNGVSPFLEPLPLVPIYPVSQTHQQAIHTAAECAVGMDVVDIGQRINLNNYTRS